MIVTARSTPIRSRLPDVLINAESLDVRQPFRLAASSFGFDLDRVPSCMPLHVEMACQCRHGRVVVGERIRRPPHRPAGEDRPRQSEVMRHAERHRLTAGLGMARSASTSAPP
jgi:hypothetical protein